MLTVSAVKREEGWIETKLCRKNNIVFYRELRLLNWEGQASDEECFITGMSNKVRKQDLKE